MVLRAIIEVSDGTEESLYPSTALLKYGYDLQEMADIKESVGIIVNDKEMQTEAANFIKLKEKKWRYNGRVNKHLRLDKIAIKGFSPEISSFVPFLPIVENPHKSLHGKCPIFTKIQNGGQPT